MKIRKYFGVIATAVTFLFFSQFLNFAVASKKQESHLDIIEKAQNLMLQKERQRAMQLLVQAIQKENAKTAQGRQLISVLNQISTVFITDKAQQLYELALTVSTTDRGLSLSRINDALRVENNHLLLLSMRARIHISQSECFDAKSVAQNIFELNPHYSDLSLLMAQIAACESKWEEFEIHKAKVETKVTGSVLAWIVLDAEKQFHLQDFKKLSDLIEQMGKTDKSYPEAYYWNWKKLMAQQEAADIPARKYLNLCKNISEKKKRSYIFDPKLCRGITEIETYLQKNG